MRAGHPLWKRRRKRRLTVAAYVAAKAHCHRADGRSEELLERFIDRRRMPYQAAVYAVVTRFISLMSSVVAALAPFDISYDLKLHSHRRFGNQPRSRWLREQLAAVFRSPVAAAVSRTPAPLLHPS